MKSVYHNFAGQNLATFLSNAMAYPELYPMTVTHVYAFFQSNGFWLYWNDFGQDLQLPIGNPPSGTTSVLTKGSNEIQFDQPQIEMNSGSQDSKAIVTFYGNTDNAQANSLGRWSQFQQGLFDGCPAYIFTLFWQPQLGVTVGIIKEYGGFIGQVVQTRTKIVLTLNSIFQQLNLRMPKNVYQPGCSHALFDAGCTKVKSAYQCTFTVTSASGTEPLQAMNSTFTGGTVTSFGFNLGSINFVTGLNTGYQRSIKNYTPVGANSVFILMSPLPNVISPGDQFQAWPGCDKTQNTCTNVYNNINNFRGFPYIPPETVFF
jgi:uncharacterized phage protein (TIGR02218 family)